MNTEPDYEVKKTVAAATATIALTAILAMITARRVKNIERRLDGLSKQTVQQTCDQRADNHPEKPFEPAESTAGGGMPLHLLPAEGGDADKVPVAVAVGAEPAPAEEIGLGGREKGLGLVNPVGYAPGLTGERVENGEIDLVHADDSNTNRAEKAHN